MVVIHCNAGKGRTGTIISCYLIYCGLAENAHEAMIYYGWKRFSHGRGVTQPSQVRYVHYFEQVYKRIVRSPVLKKPLRLVISTYPTAMDPISVKPFMEIVNGTDFSLVSLPYLLSTLKSSLWLDCISRDQNSIVYNRH